MPYVRARMAPASKEYARQRAETNRRLLAPNAMAPGDRFQGALDWFRAARAYAGRRSYRSQAIGEGAIARLEHITAEAARTLQDRACEIDAMVPKSFRRQTRRVDLRFAYDTAHTPRDQFAAARAWFLFIAKQADRYGGEAERDAMTVKDQAAVSLIEWAEEMDADDYGE